MKKKAAFFILTMIIGCVISVGQISNPKARAPKTNSSAPKVEQTYKSKPRHSMKSKDKAASTQKPRTNSASLEPSFEIEYIAPQVGLYCTSSLTVKSVNISSLQTVITFSFNNSVSQSAWMQIDPKACIIANGIKYYLERAEGIMISPKKTDFDYVGQSLTFSLFFPAIPESTSSIDFIESDDSEWRVYGIQLKSSYMSKSSAASDNQSVSSQEQKNRIIRQAIENMVRVVGGTFTMGATSEQVSDAGKDETPIHVVTVYGFYISKYEVTQDLWAAVMGYNPSHYHGGLRHPVEMVSWNDCQVFINKLNQLTGYKFRLPTEAEWEYAARGGDESKNYKYSGSNSVYDVAWYKQNSAGESHEVGIRVPNELGLYDMSGNVCEWCQDWFGEYSETTQSGPQGPPDGHSRIVRGGGWDIDASSCRTSYRNYLSPNTKLQSLGFRLAATSL